MLVAPLAAVALAAGCGGGDDEADADGTIQQLKITYTPNAQETTADTWSLKGGADAASRSRVFQDGELASDIALSDGFLEVYTPEAGQVVESPAQSAVSPDPFAIADGLVAAGTLTKAGTVTRDGRELQVYTGSPEYFLLAGAKGSFSPIDAKVRYLRDDAAGRPVELRIPAATVTTEAVSNQRTPTQRFVVTNFREYPATEEAMEVFDLKTAYDGVATGTTTAP
ncbi:MAG: hypothetical protein AB7O78_10015 [Thermoleophilia bacterium]